MNVMNEQRTLQFQCCFCHDGMTPAGTTALIIVLNWANEKEQMDQQFFCHRACFERITGETVDVDKNVDWGDEEQS